MTSDPLSPEPEVRAALDRDVPQLASSLAGAFVDDPPARWLLPDEKTRRRRLEIWFGTALRKLYLRHGECYTTDDLAGAALWVPPDAEHLGLAEQLRLLPLAGRIFGRHLPRNLVALSGSEGHHPRAPHYYLPFMGVEPARQGQGIGSALLRPVLRQCDADDALAYLEASSERNRHLYERHGFELSATTRLGRGGPPLWLMTRAPAQSSHAAARRAG